MNELTDKEFSQLVDFIKSNYGINIKEEKRALLVGRLYNTLAVNGYNSFTEFYNDLISNKSREAVTTLINRITTNHTYFLREKDHFIYFKDTVLPYLEKSVTNRDLRIWCAACSSGEESYTLEMIIQDYFGKSKLYWDSKILATDISEKVLQEAKKGIYTAEKIEPLPATWINSYFHRYDDYNYEVNDNIKDEIIYRKFNLMEKIMPFKKKFHVIFCRNVMIYFDNPTKVELVNRLRYT
jgi:chemotaxis protein methyltransferase CheR